MQTRQLILLFFFCFLAGCAHQAAVKNDFMKNTPEQVRTGKLPFSNETGLIYDV